MQERTRNRIKDGVAVGVLGAAMAGSVAVVDASQRARYDSFVGTVDGNTSVVKVGGCTSNGMRLFTAGSVNGDGTVLTVLSNVSDPMEGEAYVSEPVFRLANGQVSKSSQTATSPIDSARAQDRDIRGANRVTEFPLDPNARSGVYRIEVVQSVGSLHGKRLSDPESVEVTIPLQVEVGIVNGKSHINSVELLPHDPALNLLKREVLPLTGDWLAKSDPETNRSPLNIVL